MSNLNNAVTKTMNFVFADIDGSANEVKKRISSLKANIGKVAMIPLDDIDTNENIRQAIDTESDGFIRLVESIKKYGILENIVVELRLNSTETEYKLICVAGHRRILAAKIANTHSKIPCMLQWYNHKSDFIGTALAENLNREDLHCMDIAEGYNSLIQLGWSEEDLSRHYCRDIRTIRHYLKIANWPDDIKNIIKDNRNMLSTRVIMRQFAYKKFASFEQLKEVMHNYLNPKDNLPSKKKKPLDKKNLRIALQLYLSKQKVLSDIIKEEIKKAFVELNLI